MREAAGSSLGPRWTPKELRSFYILLKVHGEQWERLEELLPGRSAAMMRALFDMHRGYLALPEASADGFCAVMTDHYEAQKDREFVTTPSVAPLSAAVGGDTDGAVKNEPRLASPDANSATTGPRKRESLGIDASAKRDGQTPKIKKKRRLDKLLSLDGGDQLEQQTIEQLRIRSESDAEMPDASGESAQTNGNDFRRRPGKSRRVTATPRPARWWLQDPSFSEVQGHQFDLPWYCWFYSCDDDAFFHHDEFVDCLNRMGLGRIQSAARPIWSSVRSSMGHPRRLSPLFFTQEKLKLAEFRKLRRRPDHEQIRPRMWPFLRPLQLRYGTKVIVWMEMYQRCLMGTVVSSSPQEGVCTVVATTSSSDGSSEVDARLLCPLSSVMVLDFLQPHTVEQDIEAQGTASLLRRSDSRKKRSQALPARSSKPSGVSFTPLVKRDGGNFHENRLRAVLAVKGMLQRKEQILSAMARLNEQAAKLQHESLKANGLDKSQLWTTPTRFSSAALKDVSWANAGVRKALQEQHTWLAQNLETTNEYLKASLLQLNSFTPIPEDPSNFGDSGVDEMLGVDEMRWAIQFLNGSQQRAAALVGKTVESQQPSVAGSPEGGAYDALPQTKQLISSCLSLMSVFKAAERSDFAASVPPVVLHKLIDRMIELLKPSHADNMDLYAELKTAADGVQAQLASRTATR